MIATQNRPKSEKKTFQAGDPCADCGRTLTSEDVAWEEKRAKRLARGKIPELKSLALEMPVKVEAVCPVCGEILTRMLDGAYANSPHAWRISGYLVRYCPDCEQRFEGERLEAEAHWMKSTRDTYLANQKKGGLN